MRIVYNLQDQDWETTKSLGVVHVSLRILEGLASRPEIESIDVLANRSLAPFLRATLARSGRCLWHGLDSPAPRRWKRLLWDHWSVARAADRLRADWLLLPKGFAPLARWPRARVSAYVHDDIFNYYRQRRENPFPPGQATLFARCLARTAARANVIVTNSAFTAGELQHHFSPSGRVVPVGAPVEVGKRTPARDLSDGALLLPTSAWPHKLTVQAVDWLQRWETETGSRRAVHGFGSLPPSVLWPKTGRWVHHGRIREDAFRELRATACALIYFSAYEGYGLPPVEAAAQGLRGIASDLPPLRETMPATCLFENTAYASFSSTLTRVLASPPLPPLNIDTAETVAARWLAALT